MSHHMQFTIACSANSSELIGKVQKLIKDGWKLRGRTYTAGVESPMINFFNHYPTTQTFTKCQNLTKI